MEEECGGGKLLNSWQLGSRRREKARRRGRVQKYTLPNSASTDAHPPSWPWLLTAHSALNSSTDESSDHSSIPWSTFCKPHLWTHETSGGTFDPNHNTNTKMQRCYVFFCHPHLCNSFVYLKKMCYFIFIEVWKFFLYSEHTSLVGHNDLQIFPSSLWSVFSIFYQRFLQLKRF